MESEKHGIHVQTDNDLNGIVGTRFAESDSLKTVEDLYFSSIIKCMVCQRLCISSEGVFQIRQFNGPLGLGTIMEFEEKSSSKLLIRFYPESTIVLPGKG
jgi:hypothetical protein